MTGRRRKGAPVPASTPAGQTAGRTAGRAATAGQAPSHGEHRARRRRAAPAAAPTATRGGVAQQLATQPRSPSPRARRRALRESRRARTRRQLLVVGAVVAGVVVLAGALLWNRSGAPEDSFDPAGARTEQTLALVLAPPGGGAQATALLVADPVPTTGGVLLIQSRLLVEGAAPESVPFAVTARQPDPAVPGVALATTLAVLVDDTWQLTPDGLARWVDGVGGVSVEVDVEVVALDGGGGGQVLLTPGVQTLAGQQAAAFATYLAPGEPEEARLARFNEVLVALLDQLPADPAAVFDLLVDVVDPERATIEADEVAPLLVTLAAAIDADAASFETLPTRPVDVGGPKPTLAVDPAGLERLRATLFADSLPTERSGGELRVLVENGVGTPDLEQAAASLLRASGMTFINGGNASSFGRAETVVIIPDATTTSRAQGEEVARALGLSPSAVRTSDSDQTVADVLVILGADFDGSSDGGS